MKKCKHNIDHDMECTCNFWSKIDMSDHSDDECWYWKGNTNDKGYGRLYVNGKQMYAHRHSYLIHRGHIPQGLTIDHLCRNTSCVNPSHMELVTSKENTLRGECPSAQNKRKTHCKNGHELSGNNLYIRPDGRGRHCNICKKIAKDKYIASQAIENTQALMNKRLLLVFNNDKSHTERLSK